MANNWKGEVEIEAGGEKLLFRLGVNEMIEIQGDFGLAGKDEEFAAVMQAALGLKRSRDVIFRGLQLHQPEVTIRQAGDLINELGVERTGDVIREAFVLAFPAPKEGGDTRPSGGPTSS